MDEQIIPLLRIHNYFRGVSDAAIQATLRVARVRHFETGDVAHEATKPLTSVGFLLRGRLKAVEVDSRGRETLFRMVGRGEQFGMMAGAMSSPVPVRVIALEPSIVLELAYEEAMELTFQHRDLRRLWLRTFADGLMQHFFEVGQERSPMILGLLHEGDQTHAVATQLCERLSAIGERLAVLSDREEWRGRADVRWRRLHAEALDLEEIRAQSAAWRDVDRIIFEIHADVEPSVSQRLLGLVDRAFYVTTTDNPEGAMVRLRMLTATNSTWRDKLAVCWVLRDSQQVGPIAPHLLDYVARDFKLFSAGSRGLIRQQDLERLVHDLRGIRIGLSLGGGAARGMAHLGVLRVLEENGIVVDAIAGTSAGAMTGVLYASGLDCNYAAERFAIDLRPSWLFRHIPHGTHWHLLYQYRLGHFDRLLRKYLHQWELEQLRLPCIAVALDLVSGSSIIRDRGDAVAAILESINLPILSVPICRDGQALVDGGLVKNIPADVLVSMGCNFVIAVSVTAQIEADFCGITPGARGAPRSRPTITQTLLRSLLVQNYSLNALAVQPADLVIEPDVTGFEPAEFTRVNELAAIGAAETERHLPRIRQLLTRLDPQLFGAARLATRLTS